MKCTFHICAQSWGFTGGQIQYKTDYTLYKSCMHSVLSICTVYASTYTQYITAVCTTVFWPLSFFALDWRATVLIQRNPATFPLFKRSQLVCPVLHCSKNCFLIVSEGEMGKSIWKNKQKSQSVGRLGWCTANRESCSSLPGEWIGLEDNRERGGNGPLYTAWLMKI